MKNKIIVFLIFIILISAGIFVFLTNQEKMQNDETGKNDIVSQSEETANDVVIIKNNEIRNENLIDEFIEKSSYSNVENQELNIMQDDTKIQLTYTSGEYAKVLSEEKNENGVTVPVSDGSFSDNKKIYGYYSLIINDELKGEYPLMSNQIKRTVEDNKVILYFDALLIEYETRPEICTYNLDSSEYNKKFDLTYAQRKDLGIEEIFDTGEYKIKTFGGNVTITIEGDMVYSLEDALNKKIITPEDILSQTKMDSKYGICKQGMYSDGGSAEYCYYSQEDKQYTILKLNTLDGDNDLVIGMGGQIINLYNKNK